MAVRLLRTCEHSLFFMSCSVAIAPIKPPLVITVLLFFMVAAAFIAFIAFMAFMGAMVTRLSGERTSEEQAGMLSKPHL